jgi:hypothetical protein
VPVVATGTSAGGGGGVRAAGASGRGEGWGTPPVVAQAAPAARTVAATTARKAASVPGLHMVTGIIGQVPAGLKFGRRGEAPGWLDRPNALKTILLRRRIS